MEREARIQAFWQKSKENLAVHDSAYGNKQYNAAASRYYYALWLAMRAYLEAKEIEPPALIKVGGKEVKNKLPPDRWPRKELHKKAGKALGGIFKNVKNIMENAFTLRLQADYDHTDVTKPHLDLLLNISHGLLGILQNEIKCDE